MEMTLKTKIGLWMGRGIATIFAILEARGCYKHYTTEDWPAHAQFHSLTGLSYYIAVVIALWAITGKPFRDRQKWAWWAIPLTGVFVHGSMLVIDHFNEGLRGGGTSQGSGMMFWKLAILAFVLYQVAAFLTRDHFKEG